MRVSWTVEDVSGVKGRNKDSDTQLDQAATQRGRTRKCSHVPIQRTQTEKHTHIRTPYPPTLFNKIPV